jgi:hypothetical protein
VLAVLLFAGAGATVAVGQGDSYTRMLSTTMSATNSLFTAQTAVIQQRKSMAIAAGVWPAGTGPTTTAPRPQPLPQQYPIMATDFKPVSGPIMPDRLADAATGVDAAGRETMRKLFRQALTSFEGGARKNNMANAFAFLTAVALQIKTGSEPTNAQTDFLIAYFNSILVSTPAYRTYSAEQLQTLYESLVITGNMLALIDAQGKQTNNANLKAQAGAMSQAVLKQFLGVDTQ